MVRREETSPPDPWFAVRVKSNFERVVATHLEARGFNEFLPTYRDRRRWSDRTKDIELPLFPGYVFCQFDVMHRLPIISIPGFVGIVGCGKVPTSVDSAELDAIRSVVESGVLARPWPFLRVGHQVVLRRGPLAGLEGILLGFKSGQRVVLSITLLQRSVAVDVDADWVRPILYSLPDRTLPLKSYRPAV